MLAPWRKHADRVDFRWERSFDGGGRWILVVRNPDGNPVAIDTRPASGQRSSARRHAADDDYRGVHKAPGPHSGIPVHDMTGSDADGGVPEDWYTHPHYYSHGEVSDRERDRVQKMYNQARGNPDHPVTVYRALPTGRTRFNTGDWVTPSLEYAQGHAIQDDDPANDWPVISTTVPAQHLWGNGDSYYEMGYHGPHTEGKLA